MSTPITLMKGKHTVTTTSAIEAENLKGVGYRVITPQKSEPVPARPRQNEDSK